MEELTLMNQKPQNNKRFIQSTNENHDLPVIKYSHLVKLNLAITHFGRNST
jgi:hypothetical protein